MALIWPIGESGAQVPTNMLLNWAIPEFVKSSVGSSEGITGEEGTFLWPRFSKNSTKVLRTFPAFNTQGDTHLLGFNSDLQAIPPWHQPEITCNNS